MPIIGRTENFRLLEMQQMVARFKVTQSDYDAQSGSSVAPLLSNPTLEPQQRARMTKPGIERRALETATQLTAAQPPKAR
jgi:hypothetical protein